MRLPNPERRLYELQKLTGGEQAKTKQGVPILKLSNATACYFGEAEKFRLFDLEYKKLADFDDTKEGRQALADVLKELK